MTGSGQSGVTSNAAVAYGNEGAAGDGSLRLEWGSRKHNSDAARSVLLTEIVEISRVIFEDAPDYADPQMALCFNVGDTAALKILADTVTDATILAFGFGLLVDEARARRQDRRCWRSSPARLPHIPRSAPAMTSAAWPRAAPFP